MNSEHRCMIGAAVAVAVFGLAACDHKQPAPTCGTTDTPPCAIGDGGTSPSSQDHGPEQKS